MLKSLVKAVFGTRHQRELKRLQPIVDEINRQFERLKGLSDDELTTLVDRRLLRIEPARGSDRVELTHDLLTGVVRAARLPRAARARPAHRRRPERPHR